MTGESIQYFVFDIESVADGELIRKVRFPGEELDSATAVSRYRAELMEKSGSDFIPYTFQIPTSIVIAKVSNEFRLIDLVSLDAPTQFSTSRDHPFVLGRLESLPTSHPCHFQWQDL